MRQRIAKPVLMALVVPACLLVLETLRPAAAAQGGTKSESKVKASATADKAGADGKQVVTITLAIDKGWHAYANPVDLQDLTDAQTTVTVTGKGKPEVVKIDYPAGKLKKDAVVGDYKVYEDRVEIKATVRRANGDTNPLDVAVKLQVCSERTCLQPSTVKLTVP